MAYWDSKAGQIVYFESQEDPDWPGWLREDCGCCGGIRWGGESPEECDSCAGSGVIWRHKASGSLAQWPGGPFLGKADPEAA